MVPHWICYDDVVGADLAGWVFKLRIDHRVPAGDFDIHVMDDRVHIGNSVTLGLQFLAAELERHAADGVEFPCDKLELDEQPG